jgi:DNA-binding ferritin-like protein (Dps family)
LGKGISFLKAFAKDIGKRKLKHSDKLWKVSITINVECSNIFEKILDMMEKFIMERYL